MSLQINSGLGHDGLTINEGVMTIHQRTLGKGDVSFRTADITAIEVKTPFSITPRGASLNLRVGTKKYVIRHLTKDEARAAEKELLE